MRVSSKMRMGMKVDGHDDARVHRTRGGQTVEKQELVDGHPRQSAQPQPREVGTRDALPP